LKKVNSKQTLTIPNKEVADFGYKSITELDSIQKHGGEKAQVTDRILVSEKWLTVKQENTNEQIVEKFTESFTKIYQIIVYVYRFSPFFMAFHDKKNGTIMIAASTCIIFPFTFTGVNTVFIDKIFPLLVTILMGGFILV
jgi:hypothetical protein